MVTIKPAGLATTTLVANQLSLTASYLEKYKKPCCCKGNAPVQVSVTYTNGKVTLSSSSVVVVPVIANITVVHILNNGTTKVTHFAEVFDITFQGQTALPSSVTITSLGYQYNTYTGSCSGITQLTIDDSITIQLNA